MRYFTNQEVTKIYTVSYDAVRAWIQAAQDGKSDLQLGEVMPGKWQIADSRKNDLLMRELAARGRKFKTRRSARVITPKPDFYALYSPAQQVDIVSSIQAYGEIPLQYSYFDGGADYWDEYSQRLLDEQSANTLRSTIQLLETNFDNIDRLIGDSKRVNVVDLGVGNGLPVKGLLEHLLKRGVLGRYIGIDLSPTMLAVAEKHIISWFGGKVNVETHVRDITTEGFRDLLADDYRMARGDQPLNLVTLLGATLLNVRQPEDTLRLIRSSMFPSDVLSYTTKLDTENSRRYFDFNAREEAAALSDRHKLVIELLGIDASLYEVEQFFDETLRSRFIRIRLKLDVTIHFDGDWLVNLKKDDTITLWRAWHVTARESFDQFEAAGFELLASAITADSEYLLTVSRPSVTKPN
ncbi:L-histidine N(alpha)-methyltransferase [Streptomyces sp. MBT56]|uniref:L-histidine N(alpha)-methyltransferase n=1 Tax=unclassified Streptomyces TaxID=2593676 RepID=UPI00190AB4A9|nr:MULTISPECIES: L-histidine N(alpha)-methyltransferase [unclassified Streptomyces]MBK3559771.1 L-histidine N(alpha)-methyltransferase [Streptomyces sp. MBT56]MBK3601287.1 L-histidine N(alpha)-methyltransferase [Streptomyces sp. MBT54]MBK3615266.1 L-histidine N(alpha)-methyltransferase [Streptomyces sp. MBT98]